MWELIRANKRRAVLVTAFMALLLMAVGYAVGELMGAGAGPVGLGIAFLIWIGLSLASYYNGDRIMLAVYASGLVVGCLIFTIDELVEKYGRNH